MVNTLARNFWMSVSASLVSLTLCSGLVLAQAGEPSEGIAPEHVFLKKFAGEWVSKAKSAGVPGQPEMECSGTASYRMLGQLWAVGEISGDMGGMEMRAVQAIGYDANKKKYVGTWIDSMMNHLWQYEGTVDSSGNKLTLEAEGPNFVEPGKMAKFRDSYEFKSADHIIATSSVQGADGKWITFMVGDLKRK